MTFSVRTVLLCAAIATGKQVVAKPTDTTPCGDQQISFSAIWEEEIPVMCSLAVAMDGTALQHELGHGKIEGEDHEKHHINQHLSR